MHVMKAHPAFKQSAQKVRGRGGGGEGGSPRTSPALEHSVQQCRALLGASQRDVGQQLWSVLQDRRQCLVETASHAAPRFTQGDPVGGKCGGGGVEADAPKLIPVSVLDC